MVKKLLNYFLLCIMLFPAGQLFAQKDFAFNKYHNVSEVQQILKNMQQENPVTTQLHTIATSPGGEEINVLEIGKKTKKAPGIFIGANFEGNIPISTEGALRFAQMLLDSSSYTKEIKWYILPLPNPDAAAGFFSSLKYDRKVNAFEINNDVDNEINEDGFDDLNGDGFITKMRIKDLEGKYIVSSKDPRIMQRADINKGERGIYKMYSEGLDNDGDGTYNEDGEGGINIGISFPHLFPYKTKEAGLYSGQSPETYGILRFIFDRPNIAMVYTLGSSDFCLAPPKGGRKGGANLENIKIPERYARRFGADPSKTYTMNEVIALIKERVPAGMEVTPAMVASFLGLGAAVNPLDDDLKFYKQFSEDYKKYLETKKFNTKTLPPAPANDGSFELWAYYHLGVPSFSMNLFSVPKVKEEKDNENEALSLDKVENMTGDEFAALGEDKVDALLKANSAPEQFSAKRVLEMIDSGKFTPKQLAGMMKKMPKSEKDDELSEKDKALLAWSEKEWKGKGFVEWYKYNHPKLGEVEIGGYSPYLETTPKPDKMDTLFEAQLPWLLQLSTKLPDIGIKDSKVKTLGDGIYKLEIYIENKGYLPYPIAMGKRNNQPAPVVIILNGDFDTLEGIKRTPLRDIGGNQVKKLSWLIKTEKKSTITATVESVVFGHDEKQIKIGG